MAEFRGPYVFKRDESGHWYQIPAEKSERFNELLYGSPDDFEWAEDYHDVTAKFTQEFGSGRGSRLLNQEFYIKEE